MMTWWNRLEQFLVGLLGACALIVGVLQVLGRYLDPEHAISWAEEVIVYLVIWGIMIVSSQLVRTDGHVRPDLVLRALPPQVQRVLEIFNCLVALAFSAGLTWYGSEIVETALLLDERSSTGLQFPMWIYDLALPAGGALMVSRYLIRIYRFSFRYDPETMALGYAIHETPLDLAQRTGD